MRSLYPVTCLSGLFFLIVPFAACQKSLREPIPVGLDAYRQWGNWPTQRIGMRTTMRSTFDRAGGNHGVDASHFLYQLNDTFNATLEVEGAGILMFERFNNWHGSPWQFVIDGKRHVIAESSTADPTHHPSQSTFLPEKAFPAPLNQTFATTYGADLIGSPIGFEHGLTLAYGRTKYGTGYYIYDQFVPGTPLSHPITNWTENDVPAKDVLDLLRKAGTDIAPIEGTTQLHGTATVTPGSVVTIADLKGKSTLRALSFSIPEDQAMSFEHLHLRITWDGRAQPSVDVPIALFFGAGSLYNREHREYLVKALPVNIRFHEGRIDLACYFPMPFFRSAHIELVAPEGLSVSLADIRWTLRTLPLHDDPSHQSYFHATFHDFPTPPPGQDLVLLDTRGIEGEKEFTGSFVGTSFIFSHNAGLGTLEGDPRFFFDDSLTPQAQGTGSEEWGGGGDYWNGGHQTTLPLLGHPVGAPANTKPENDEDKIESTYRFLLGDLFPFGKNAVIRFEHGGVDESKEHYETIAYWYGLPSTSLVQTDQLQLGDAEDEKAHAYTSPQASAPYGIDSRYEWGVDHLYGKPDTAEVYPTSHDTGRVTTTASEFELKIRRDNLGVLLRRKLDYKYPNQRAEVFIQSATKPSHWKPAGVWYLAGSNTVVYSNPKDEVGPAEHIVETSNRRFRDDEFLVPLALTAGRDRIRVRVQYTPVDRPLFPSRPLDERGWSEIKYTAYSFVTPVFKP